MKTKIVRTYSKYCEEALELLGKHIQFARKQRKISEKDLAERVGISRDTLRKVEAGNPKCEIGIVFELASTLGIKLFEVDSSSARGFSADIDHIEAKIALLPKRIRKKVKEVDDDF